MSLRCKNISIARRLGATMVLLATSAVVRGFVARTRTSRGVSLFASSTTVSAANPLLQQENLPKFTSIQPSDLTPAVETLLEKLEKDFSHLEEKLQDDCPVYDAVLPEIERMQFPVGFVWGVAGHLNGVLNSDDLREAYESNQGAIVKAMSQFSQSRPVYNALQELLKEPTPEKESFEDQQKKRALELSLRSMQLGGVGLEGEQKERFNAIKMRLATLGTSFGNNILDETKAFSKTITDATSMKGVPVSARALWAAAYQQATKAESADPDNGPWRITLDMPSYIAVLSHMRDRKIREEVYLANIRRASESSPQGKNNVPLIYEILKLKAEMANMLGFDNYAEMSLVSKMAPSIESVRELSDLILEKALPAAKQELAEITQLAKENGFPANETLQPWDTTFWSERLKETKFDLTEEQTRPYFALPAVLDGMFSLVERIFQVSVKAADGEAEVWHPDVKFFKVFDCESNEHIASFFLDPYSRPENKRGGAWMDVCIGKSSAVQRKVPVAYLTCNGSPPVGETPSLMTFREVETLFHEFGHGLQHMLTKATVGDVAGINGIEWDAVELPSQFMENWCYDEPTVYGFAKHWETGEAMPLEMFEKLKEQKTFNAGLMSCRQLLFGQLDMELHSWFDPSNGEDHTETIFTVHRRMAEKYTPHSMPLEQDRFLCTFSHIFAGGYAAGYYSYKWAEVMSADAFASFEEAGLDDEQAVRKVGRKFRDTVLSLGGGVEPMKVFKSFRGREPEPAALLRHNGLA